jgi:hypothetical protein
MNDESRRLQKDITVVYFNLNIDIGTFIFHPIFTI